GDAIARGGPHRKSGIAGAAGQLAEIAAVGTDRPHLVGARSIRIEGDARAVRRPGGAAVTRRVISEPTVIAAVEPRDEQVLLHTARREREPAAIGRDLVISNRKVTLEDRHGRPDDHAVRGIEGRTEDRRSEIEAGVHESGAVARERELPAP